MNSLKEQERILKKIKKLLEENQSISMQELENKLLGHIPIEQQPIEIEKLAYDVYQSREYQDLFCYIFQNQKKENISKELEQKIDTLLEHNIDFANIEDYALKYFIDEVYSQRKR